MEKIEDFTTSPFLEELEVFRWRLYIAKDGTTNEKIQLCEKACLKPMCELYIEECVIAGYDMTMLNDEAKLKVKRIMPNGELPSIHRCDDKIWDFSRLRNCLVHKNEPVFIKGLDLIAKKSPDRLKDIIINSYELFNVAASKNLSLAIENLVSYGAKVEDSSLLYACKYGSWGSLETLMKYSDFSENKMPLLRELFIANHNADYEKQENFDKCYNLVLQNDSVDVNAIDSNYHSSLYYVRHLPKKVQKILHMGAYIGMSSGNSVHSKPDVSFITPKVLENHLDDCINLISTENANHKKIKYIELNYQNLIPSKTNMNGNPVSHELKAMEFMSKSIDYRHLLVHPLISSFLLLKWRQWELIHKIDFILYILFAISYVGTIVAIFELPDRAVKQFLICFTSFMTIYVAIRRMIHLMFCSSEYRQSWFNYFHCFYTYLIVVCVNIALVLGNEVPTLHASCILLITCEVFVLVGSIFWSLSLYYNMFMKICKTLIKSCALYIPVVPAIFMLYYLMIRVKENDDKNEITYKENIFDQISDLFRGTDSFNEFKEKISDLIKKIANSDDDDISNEDSKSDSSVFQHLMKSMVEFHKDLHEKMVSIGDNLLTFFVLIITLISLVFMNLINGLAVNDTQIIQSEAEVICLSQRCQLLARYEDALTNKNHWFWQYFEKSFIRRVFEWFAQFDVLENLRNNSNREIHIGPRNELIHHINIQQNIISTTNRHKSSFGKKHVKADEIKFVSNTLFNAMKGSQTELIYLDDDEFENESEKAKFTRFFVKIVEFFFDPDERMSQYIVDRAYNIIERKESNKKEKLDENNFVKRIDELETQIKKTPSTQ